MDNPVVFIHGSGDSSRIWRLQVEALNELRPGRACALDLPGHGQRSDMFLTDAEVSVLDYARAVHDITFNELGLEHPIIAGHSLGGAIALMMALEYGPELGGIILIGTGARLRVHPAFLEAAKNGTPEGLTQLAEFSVAPSHVNTFPVTVARERGPAQPNMLYRDLAACDVFDVMARMEEIARAGLPTLIICGAEDRMTPVKYSQYLHDHLPGSTLHIIPDAGHYVMREQPEAVNAAIEAWIE
ncbi:MAG TPA: alpha/beta hydrolase [Ktedonobacteraceae bacterium]|nr:alpha/beta hydrolase [Ktedonobacteraceae bacterium]